MRRLGFALLVSLVLSCSIVAWYAYELLVVEFPDTYATERAQYMADARKRFQALHSLPADENSATVIGPLFTGRFSAEKRRNVKGPLGEVSDKDVAALSPEYDAGATALPEFQKLKLQDNADFREHYKQFARAEALLLTVSDRPYFVWSADGSSTDTYNSCAPNFLRFRSAIGGLCVSAVYKIACLHKPDEAVKLLVESLKLSKQCMCFDSTMQNMMAQSTALITVGCIRSIVSSTALSQQNYRDLLAALDSLPHNEEFYNKSIDLHFDPNQSMYVEFAREGALDSVSPEEALSWREKLICQSMAWLVTRHESNTFYDNHKSLHILQAKESQEKHLLIPEPWERKVAALRSYVAQIDACRILCALQLYKLEHGVYPKQLEQLVPVYLPQVPANPAVAAGTFPYQCKGGEMELSAPLGLQGTKQYYPYKSDN